MAESSSPTQPAPVTNPTSGVDPQLPVRRRRRRWILGAAVILLSLAGGGWYYWSEHGGGTPAGAATGGPDGRRGGAGGRDRVSPIVVEAATTEDFPVRLSAIGTVIPRTIVTVRSRVDGTLDRVLFQEGQSVKAGDLLAEIDPRPFEVALAQVQGQMSRDQALLANARADLSRYEGLARLDAIPSQQLDTQRALVRQYEAAVRVDQGQVDNARLQLSYTRIKAPADGRLGLRQVDPGNLVRSGDANGLVVITEVQPVTVVFPIPEADLPKLLPRLGLQAAREGGRGRGAGRRGQNGESGGGDAQRRGGRRGESADGALRQDGDPGTAWGAAGTGERRGDRDRNDGAGQRRSERGQRTPDAGSDGGRVGSRREEGAGRSTGAWAGRGDGTTGGWTGRRSGQDPGGAGAGERSDPRGARGGRSGRGDRSGTGGGRAGGGLAVEAWDRDGKVLLATGELLTVDNQIDVSTGTVKVKALFANRDGALFPNQFVNVRLVVQELKDATVIPSAAVQRGARGTFVWLVNEDNTVAMRPVRVGAPDDDRIPVLEGLNPGDKVAVDGFDRLREGGKVEVVTRESRAVKMGGGKRGGRRGGQPGAPEGASPAAAAPGGAATAVPPAPGPTATPAPAPGGAPPTAAGAAPAPGPERPAGARPSP